MPKEKAEIIRPVLYVKRKFQRKLHNKLCFCQLIYFFREMRYISSQKTRLSRPRGANKRFVSDQRLFWA